jgi:thiamine kinase-like enzyme
MVKSGRQEWKMKPFESEELVFNHGDLSTYNVIVDPVTLKVKAVIDWEYAGFYPAQFEGNFFERVGPSVAQKGEENDEDRLLDIMIENELR